MELKLNDKGHIKNRESQAIEFKESFQLGDSLYSYARTLVGMANNQGGSIIFGVQDKPHLPVGLKNDKFQTEDPKNLNSILLSSFSSDIEWEQNTFEAFGVTFGVISVSPATAKPIVCTRNHHKAKLREGAIYFRYRGETKEIRHAELQALLQAEREKEKRLWMSHIQSIASIGPQAVQIIDAQKGEMDVGGKKVLIDSDLVSKLKVIKEGHFDEKEGAPALRVIGEIEGLASSDSIYTETAYPLLQQSFLDKLPINSYEFQAIAWKLGLKGDPRYHMEVSTGKKGKVQKYSTKALALVRDKIRQDPDFIAKCRESYAEFKKKKK